MANKHYYLIASLPFLKFGDQPPFSKVEFIEECGKWFDEKEMETLLSADLLSIEERPQPHQVLNEWNRFDSELRGQLARVREARKKGEDYRVPEALKTVMEQEDPLMMERELERLRWRFLEEEYSKHFFDINNLILYFLQIQILERLAGFDKDKGENFFYQLCEVNYE